MTEDFFAHLGTHAALAGCALILAAAVAIPLGGVAADRPAARSVLLAFTGGLRVVPSLAILMLALPLLGLGFAPALLALVVLAIPPILVTTDVGLRSVPATTLDAARGTGMTPRQVGLHVRWPLALPIVASGIRTASVEVIASATLASFIGAGGLGDYIVQGLQSNDVAELLLGAVSVAVLALGVDAGFAAVTRRVAA